MIRRSGRSSGGLGLVLLAAAGLCLLVSRACVAPVSRLYPLDLPSGEWIESADGTPNAYFRKELAIEGPVRDAWLAFAAPDCAVRAVRERTSVASQAMAERTSAGIFDIGPRLKPGKNVVALHVSSGNYTGAARAVVEGGWRDRRGQVHRFALRWELGRAGPGGNAGGRAASRWDSPHFLGRRRPRWRGAGPSPSELPLVPVLPDLYRLPAPTEWIGHRDPAATLRRVLAAGSRCPNRRAGGLAARGRAGDLFGRAQRPGHHPAGELRGRDRPRRHHALRAPRHQLHRRAGGGGALRAAAGPRPRQTVTRRTVHRHAALRRAVAQPAATTFRAPRAAGERDRRDGIGRGRRAGGGVPAIRGRPPLPATFLAAPGRADLFVVLAALAGRARGLAAGGDAALACRPRHSLRKRSGRTRSCACPSSSAWPSCSSPPTTCASRRGRSTRWPWAAGLVALLFLLRAVLLLSRFGRSAAYRPPAAFPFRRAAVLACAVGLAGVAA